MIRICTPVYLSHPEDDTVVLCHVKLLLRRCIEGEIDELPVWMTKCILYPNRVGYYIAASANVPYKLGRLPQLD